MLKLKFQYFGHLMQKDDSPDAEKEWGQEKGATEHRGLYNITDSADMSLSKLQDTLKDREAGMLQSTGSQSVGPDLVTEQQQMCVSMCWVAQSCPALCSPRLLCPWNFPGKNTGVGCTSYSRGSSQPQGSNPHILHLLHWQANSLPLAPSGRPRVCVYVLSVIYYIYI